MTCPACGHEECQDRKTVLDWRKRGDPTTLHRECPNGHAWHMPRGLKRRGDILPYGLTLVRLVRSADQARDRDGGPRRLPPPVLVATPETAPRLRRVIG